MTRRKEIWILVGLSVAFGVLIFAAMLLLGSATEQRKGIGLVQHTRDVLAKISEVDASFKAASSERRAFVLSGEEKYFQGLTNHLDRAGRSIGELRKLTTDNSRQQAGIERLETMFERARSLSGNSVQARKQRGLETIPQSQFAAQEEELLTNIWETASNMIGQENDLLKARQAAVRANVEGMKGFAILLSMAAFCFFIVIAILFWRAAQRTHRAEEALRQANNQLENRVSEKSAELDKQNADLEMIFDTVPASIFYKDRNHRILRVNSEMCHVFGADAKTFIGKTDQELGARYAAQYFKDEDEVMASGRAKRGIIEPIDVAGETRWLLTNKIPYRNLKGEIVGTVGFAVDITEQKLAEKKLEEAMVREQELRVKAEASENRFRTLVEESLIGIYVIQKDRFVYVNPAMEKIFGYSAQELTCAPVLNFVFPEDRPIVHENVRKRFEGAMRSVRYTLRIVRHDQSVAHVEVRGGTSELNGQPAILGTLLDITEMKEAEEKILRLNAELESRVQERTAQLEATNRELEAFSYSVSHDLRAPLRHINGYVEMLKRATDGQLDEKPLRYLQTIASASAEMGALIDDLLAFSRVGRVELRETSISLKDLADETIRGLEMDLKDRNIQWKIGDLPTVVGDRATLKQVMANLIGNAVKYSRNRNPAEIEIGTNGKKDERAILFVRDNGAGFDMQYAGKLFGVFQRLHRAEEFEGTGIGLATVRRIIQRHGGETWAEGALDQGATFYFTLREATA